MIFDLFTKIMNYLFKTTLIILFYQKNIYIPNYFIQLKIITFANQALFYL